MERRIEIATYVVCSDYGIMAEQLTAPGHEWHQADARAILSYILRTQCEMTFMQIGRLIHRHHSTVICNVRKVDLWLHNPKIFAKENYKFESIIERFNTLTNEAERATTFK